MTTDRVRLAPTPFGGGKVKGQLIGSTVPGDWYYLDEHSDRPEACPYRWDDCDGFHLWVVLPNGCAHCLDWRASNCGAPNDRRHRCWKRNGEMPNVTHSPGCPGSCSIPCDHVPSRGRWHGYLRNGELAP